MIFDNPFILVLNITVITILLLLILPTLLNMPERLMVRLSFSAIFFAVVVNCIQNVVIFYFDNYNWLPYQIMSQFFSFLFGPAVLFYVKGINGAKAKNVWVHFILPVIAVVAGCCLFILPESILQEMVSEIQTGSYLPYNLLYLLLLVVPLFYFVIAGKYVKHIKPTNSSAQHTLKMFKWRWSKEFLNYMLFTLLAFVAMFVFFSFIYKLSSLYLDLIVMPLFFCFAYAIIAVRSNMVSKEVEIQYALSDNEHEKNLQEQRLAISRNLHDNIGAYANSLIAKIDYMESSTELTPAHIHDLKEHAEIILSLLRQTIWVLNNKAMHLDSYLDYIKQYVLKTCRYTGVKAKFSENIINNISLNTKEASNIFRIVQESVQNILKHAGASEIVIHVDSDEVFEITISDNGSGFQAGNKSEGDGLQNMQVGAAEIGMEFLISSPGRGTVITLKRTGKLSTH